LLTTPIYGEDVENQGKMLNRKGRTTTSKKRSGEGGGRLETGWEITDAVSGGRRQKPRWKNRKEKGEEI